MAEHHQQYMRNNSLRLFPEGGPEMDPAMAAAAAAAAMLTEKARSALGLPPASSFYRGGPTGRSPAAGPGESPFPPPPPHPFQLYGRPVPHHPPPPPHFWSQFYGLNHQLGLLSNLAGQLQPSPAPSATAESSSTSGSPPPSSSPFQRFSPYPLMKPGRTPSPRVGATIPSPK